MLYAPEGREDGEYVAASIESIRAELATALKALDPNSAVPPLLEVLRQACREYLDAVAASTHGRASLDDFGPALAQLRKSFREVAEDVADLYDLPTARELADEMRQADEAALRGSELRTLPERPEDREGPEPLQHDNAVGTAGETSPSYGPLVDALGDSDAMVRFHAMMALRDHLTLSLLPVLEPLLKDRDSDIRQYAVEYYAELNPPDVTERLVDALGDSDVMVRFHAMTALRDHLTPSLLPVLEPLLKDRDSDIRQYAVEYYAQLHKP